MTAYQVIYDDSCPFCRASVERLEQLDKLGIVRRIPLSQIHQLRNISLPPESQLRQSLHVILPDRTIIAGADAVARLVGLLPRSRWLAKLIMLPGIRSLARFTYRQIAARRMLVSRLLGLELEGDRQHRSMP